MKAFWEDLPWFVAGNSVLKFTEAFLIKALSLTFRLRLQGHHSCHMTMKIKTVRTVDTLEIHTFTRHKESQPSTISAAPTRKIRKSSISNCLSESTVYFHIYLCILLKLAEAVTHDYLMFTLFFQQILALIFMNQTTINVDKISP